MDTPSGALRSRSWCEAKAKANLDVAIRGRWSRAGQSSRLQIALYLGWTKAGYLRKSPQSQLATILRMTIYTGVLVFAIR